MLAQFSRSTSCIQELAGQLADFDEFLYFPSIGWDHSWERQQTLISAFCCAHAEIVGQIFTPSGLIDYAPWKIDTWSQMRRHVSTLGAASAQAEHTQNPRPENFQLIKPRFPRGTNSVFALLASALGPSLPSIKPHAGKKRLVFASYVNPFVERYLAHASFSILDLAERRQANPALSRQIKTLEEKWAGRVNLLVADNLATLTDYHAVRLATGRQAGHVIPQGFSADNIRIEPRTPNRVAAYLGNLHQAIDYPLFVSLAKKNPDWTFKLCGQIMSPDAEALTRQPNVRYVGTISSEAIPEFLRDADIGLIPYARNDWTAGVFPTKLFEYLSNGLPVLSTSIPEVKQFDNGTFVRICDEPALLTVPPIDCHDLLQFIQPHTWQARISTYAAAVANANAKTVS